LLGGTFTNKKWRGGREGGEEEIWMAAAEGVKEEHPRAAADAESYGLWKRRRR
jgi:hypothetical protein